MARAGDGWGMHLGWALSRPGVDSRMRGGEHIAARLRVCQKFVRPLLLLRPAEIGFASFSHATPDCERARRPPQGCLPPADESTDSVCAFHYLHLLTLCGWQIRTLRFLPIYVQWSRSLTRSLARRQPDKSRPLSSGCAFAHLAFGLSVISSVAFTPETLVWRKFALIFFLCSCEKDLHIVVAIL